MSNKILYSVNHSDFVNSYINTFKELVEGYSFKS